jgi:hypothetical protein
MLLLPSAEAQIALVEDALAIEPRLLALDDLRVDVTRAAGSDPTGGRFGVRLPRALLFVFEARALLGLMASDEAARRCPDYSVMTGVVAGGTADDGALQASPGRGRRCQRCQK